MDCPEARQLPEEPPSARTVLCTLLAEGPLTMQDIQRESGLARRTVYGAIRRLRARGLIAQQVSLRDTRQTMFWVRP